MWQQLLTQIQQGNTKALARTISLVENEFEGHFSFLQNLPTSTTPIIGITGPPGAGKSTLVDALIGEMVSHHKRVGVLCVDPSSPFNLGALLGDRIRMSQWYNHPNVFIRSLATRGSLGGLHPKIIEIADVMKAAPFDYIIIETVGIGQSEIEIAGLADTTIVVLVPEGGDDIQTMKAGLMEIADVFVVNKADRPGADAFANNLKQMLLPGGRHTKVLQTVASAKVGMDVLYDCIVERNNSASFNDKHSWLLAEKAIHLIQHHRMMNIDRKRIKDEIERRTLSGAAFNIYSFVAEFYK